jgi:hypothetical protein
MQIKRAVSRIQARIHAAELIENAAEFAARSACNEGAVDAHEHAIVSAKSPRSKLKLFGFQGKKKPDATVSPSPQALGEPWSARRWSARPWSARLNRNA